MFNKPEDKFIRNCLPFQLNSVLDLSCGHYTTGSPVAVTGKISPISRRISSCMVGPGESNISPQYPGWIVVGRHLWWWWKEVSKSNFWQYGQMDKQRWEESGKRKSQTKQDQGARKGTKVAKHCVFSVFCCSGGSKSRLAKAAGAEPSGEMRDQKLQAVVARSTCRSQHVQNTWLSEHFWQFRCSKSARHCGAKHSWKSNVLKTDRFGSTFGSSNVEKVHTVVAQNTFRSQHVQNTSLSHHCWKLRCS